MGGCARTCCRLPTDSVVAMPGHGISGIVEGHMVVVGSAVLAQQSLAGHQAGWARAMVQEVVELYGGQVRGPAGKGGEELVRVWLWAVVLWGEVVRT